MSAPQTKTRKQLWEEERERRRETMKDGLNELREHLMKNPQPITKAVQLGKDRWGLPHHITRVAVDTWIREGRLGERKQPVGGKGRPRRVVGGMPT